MRAIFQKMAKTIITKGKIFENLDKNVHNTIYSHTYTCIYAYI